MAYSFRAKAVDGKVKINWGDLRHAVNFLNERDYDVEGAEEIAARLVATAKLIYRAIDDVRLEANKLTEEEVRHREHIREY